MAEYAETRRDERAAPPPAQRRPTQAARATPSSAARVLGLQASAGNRAVAAMLQRTAPPRAPAAPEVGTTSTAGAPSRDLDQPSHLAQDEGPIGAADDDRVDRAERATAATDPHTTHPTAVPSRDRTRPPNATPARPPTPNGPPDGPPDRPRTVVQRATATARAGPHADPKFKALKQDVKAKQHTLTQHPPPATEAGAAQAAARPPQDDKLAQGKAANAEKMNAAKPGEFNKAAFIAAVNAAIAKQAPKNLDEADKFADSGKADAVKGEVQGKVGDGKKASAGAIETTTKAPPDTAAAKDKSVTPLTPDRPPGKPAGPDPARAVPDKAPAQATDLSAGPRQVNDQMADAQVTEDQLAKSNEPEFTGALKEKKAGEAHAAAAPAEVRQKETATLTGAKADASQAGATAMTAMTTARVTAGKQVTAGKTGAQSEDEKKHAQVTAKLQTVYDATKKDVEDILTGLDKKVDDQFTAGEKTARDAFTAQHKREMNAYKDKRYSGLIGKGRWLKDKFAGLPDEANQIFDRARQGYVTAMQGVISRVADTIGGELTRAKARIAKGRTDLQSEVRKLPADLQAIGKQAAGEFAGQFDELTQSVDDKGTALVDTLASKYTEALKSVDDTIAAEKEKNKGLIAKAVDAVKGVIQTILQLKQLLLGVLAKAAQAVGAIIKDPIGFLGKLVSAVGAGLRSFMARIGEHLQKGLLGWLLGAAANAGLQLPAKFDLRGIIGMIGSLLGLTWAAIRGRIVSKGVPEQAMGAVEQTVPEAQKLQSEGITGVWQSIAAKVGNLKANLFGKITEYLIPTVLIAGITWIISLLNPASAFIKACKMIIDFVTFIIERGAQIVQLVNAVLDAVIGVAAGSGGGVPALIENALVTSIPVLIGVLAAILGIGGIADKVKKFFQSLSKPVMKAVDWVVDKLVKFGKKIWGKLKARARKKDKAGRPVPARSVPASGPADPSTMTPRQKALVAKHAADEAMRDITKVPVSGIPAALQSTLANWRPQGVKSFDMQAAGNHRFKVTAKVNPEASSTQTAHVGDVPMPLTFGETEVWKKPGGGRIPSVSHGTLTITEKPRYFKGQSSQKAKVREELDAHAKSHAEEQVVLGMEREWVEHGQPKDVAVGVRIEVNRSSCPNCAHHIVGFKRKLEADGRNSVAVSTRFAQIYQPPRKAKISQAAIDSLSPKVVDQLVTNGKLTVSPSPARWWGRASEGTESPGTSYVLRGGKQHGMLGLAILRQGQVSVSGLTEADLEKQSADEMTDAQREALEDRARLMKKAVDKVDALIDGAKAG